MELQKKGFRVRVDDRNETMGLKTRQLQKAKVPFMIVIGDKEIESKSAALRAYGQKFTKVMTNEEMINHFFELDSEKMPKAIRE